MAIICIVVLLFPIKETLKSFFPLFSITYCLKVDMTNSRATMIKAGIATATKDSIKTNHTITRETNNLSAIRSKRAPN